MIRMPGDALLPCRRRAMAAQRSSTPAAPPAPAPEPSPEPAPAFRKPGLGSLEEIPPQPRKRGRPRKPPAIAAQSAAGAQGE